MITPDLMVKLLLILSLGWVLGYSFSRFGLPVMLGELLAGVILGPPVLGLVGPTPAIDLLAELGIFFVMFHTGVELDPRELLQHFRPCLAVAIGGFVIPFALGFATAAGFGGTFHQALFVGMGVSITAIAVQAVVLHSMRIHQSELGHIIIGAAIVDDILALIVLSTLLGLVGTGSIQFSGVAVILAKVIVFFAATIFIGEFIVPRISGRLTDKNGKAFTFAMTSALLMAYLAELAGLHLVIGAFLAGQFVRREVMDEKVYKAVSDQFYSISYGFLLPIFFASLSFHLHFVWQGTFLLFCVVLVIAAIAGKLIGCGIGALAFKYNPWEAGIIGLGMNGRGAVELVVVSLVLKLSDELLASKVISSPLLTQSQFSGLVLMAFVTTALAPVALKWAITRSCLSVEKAEFCTMWDKSRD
ncbi:MAG: cation:proton antiporter [Syntrophobacteraceae bacterium]